MNRLEFFRVFLGSTFFFASCEKYLDKAPAADIGENEVFGNFISFQGFIEQLYNCVADKNKCQAWNPYLFADEKLNAKPKPFDVGNYWPSRSYFYGKSVNLSAHNPRDKRIWEYAWYGARTANVALEKINEENLFQGTEEEKNLLKGQALFFRAWFYFQICKFWGGMPYVTKALSPTEDMETPDYKRLNFQQTAILMAKDFRAAADILPNHWDGTKPGKRTSGQNNGRVNKFYALGYLGKALLFAASPMMNEEATGQNAYNAELCQQAAEAFGELLKLADETGIYKLQSWDTWTDNFWRWNRQRPGGTEVIMEPTIYNQSRERWSTVGATVPSSFGLNSGSNAAVPTNNYIKNYRMANGLPIEDPRSGYDPNDPWTNREPRFYKDIVVDGDKIMDCNCDDAYAQLYNGGRHRSQINPASVTGYYERRYAPIGPDFTTSKANGLQAYVPYLRLADIYLMYAEAVLYAKGGGSPQSTSGNYSMTAVKAVNVIRNRAQIPDLDAKYTSDKKMFFEAIMRERAVELAFSGARFLDLRRWNLNGDTRFLNKTAIDFDRGPNGKPINISERVIVKRVIGKKNNWLPIQTEYLHMFKGFTQNPGW